MFGENFSLDQLTLLQLSNSKRLYSFHTLVGHFIHIIRGFICSSDFVMSGIAHFIDSNFESQSPFTRSAPFASALQTECVNVFTLFVGQ